MPGLSISLIVCAANPSSAMSARSRVHGARADHGDPLRL
jgi:hypothetical protein